MRASPSLRFLDDRIFATCSDDCSVSIWDLRNIKSRVRQLNGHKSWVKNIEYSQRDNLIVTSGLDGSIYTWDVNEPRYQKVFHTPGLMRCRISADESKMVICTTGGYLIIVHDLNLRTLAADLKGFRPNLHRLMQVGDQYFPIVSEYKHVFDGRQRRNRIELISDFPQHNEAEVICSLAIHPHSWVALSRNMNADEQSEWTCVHDIQEMTDRCENERDGEGGSSRSRSRSHSHSSYAAQEDEYAVVKKRVSDEFVELQQQLLEHWKAATTETSRRRGKHFLKKMAGYMCVLVDPTHCRDLPVVPATSSDMWLEQMRDNGQMRSGLITARVVDDPVDPEMTNADGIYFSSSEEEQEEGEEVADGGVATPTARFYCYVGKRLAYLINEMKAAQRLMNSKYKKNKPRLLYYAQETNAGKGYIKELCFSSDGRVIASPHGNGVRLLAFNDKCQELCDSVESWEEPQKPRALTEVSVNDDCHAKLVVCTKFSPHYPLLVSGCLKGDIVWHYPNL